MYSNQNIMVSIKTELDKILILQAVFWINLVAIILIIIPTIVLMKDQKKKLK